MIFYFYSLFFSCTTTTKDTSSTTNTPTTEPTTEPSIEDSGNLHLIPFTGKVTYEDGTEVANTNTRVQMCSEYCFPAILGSNGAFSFVGLEPGTYAFDVVPLGDQSENYATPLDFITLTDNMESYSLDKPMKIPNFVVHQELTQPELNVDNTLFISVDANTFTVREGFDSQEYVAAALIPDDSGLILDGIEGEFHQGWYLGAFEAKVESWNVRVENLEPGLTLHAYNSSYDEKTWLSLGEATVDENGIFTSPNGLKVLSGLILMKN